MLRVHFSLVFDISVSELVECTDDSFRIHQRVNAFNCHSTLKVMHVLYCTYCGMQKGTLCMFARNQAYHVVCNILLKFNIQYQRF